MTFTKADLFFVSLVDSDLVNVHSLIMWQRKMAVPIFERLEGQVAIVGRSHQDIHFFGWSFRRSGCDTTSSAFVYFYARVLTVLYVC